MNKNSRTIKRTKEYSLIQIITTIYMIIIFVGIALYSPEKYIRLDIHKWNLFIWSTTVYSIIGIIYIIWNGLYKKINFTDIFAIAYAVLCLLSYITTPYREGLWKGAKGWYMGLWSQLCFIAMYFTISRYSKGNDFAIKATIIGSLPIFIYAIMMRFGMDPLRYYDDITEQQRFYHLSTIGQTSWYSSYLVLILPISMALYVYSKERMKKLLYGIAISVESMSLVTCNTDSAFLAYGAMLFVLFWLAFEEINIMVGLIEVILISLVSFKLIGLLQYIFSDRAVRLEEMSMMISQGTISLIFLIVAILTYTLIRIVKHKVSDFDITKYKYIRSIVLSLVIGLIVVMILYIVLNTMEILPEALQSKKNYLYFDDYWGNKRGYVWKNAIYSFTHGSILQMLIGCGPDSFACSMYTIIGKVKIFEYYRNIYNTDYAVFCAHNEWLNGLVTMGIMGLTAYVGIFVCSFRNSIRKANVSRLQLAVSMAIAAYMAHNMFCYQQYVCTPVIFLLMGIARSIEESE